MAKNELDLSEMCPRYQRAMGIIGQRWTGLILRALLAGEHRFSGIAAYVPDVSDPMLSERLKLLEAEGIVVRHVYPETPVRIEYELTEKGRGLLPVVEAVQRWASDWIEAGPDVPAR